MTNSAKYLKNINKDVGLYVNYPYCANRCRYCLYHIDRYTPDKSKNFLKYFQKEIDLYRKMLDGFKFTDLHIGGGTPNLAPVEDLLEPLKPIVDFKNIRHFIVEVFPKVDLPDYILKLKKFHITKISLGVQTLDEKILFSEKRYASRKIILDNLEFLSKAKIDWSVDLIYGFEGEKDNDERVEELKTILACKPSGLHLYNIRSQKENNNYGGEPDGKLPERFKKINFFDYQKITKLLLENNYELIGDEWCRKNKKHNIDYAKREADYFGEAPTLGLGLWARSRLRQIKCRNARDLSGYMFLLDKKRLPIVEFFCYDDKYFLISDFLLSLNQSLNFPLDKAVSSDRYSHNEKKELLKIITLIKRNKISCSLENGAFVLAKEHFSRALRFIENYLFEQSGRKYFYKN